jgi:DNA-binding transcriptional MerR regulator
VYAGVDVSEMPQIPDKAMYKSSEVCEYTKTQPYVLRFWESEFPQLSPARGRGGQPIYRRTDIDLILRIKQLLYDEEYTIDGARQRLEQEQGTESPVSAAATTNSPPEAGATADNVGPRRPAQRRRGLPPQAPRGSDSPVVRPAAAVARQELMDFDSVPRERYEDAVDEIAHLRLQLREAETRTRKAESAARHSEEIAERTRERAHRAIQRLEKLLELLS